MFCFFALQKEIKTATGHMADLRYGNNMEGVPSTTRETLSSGCAQQACRAAFKITAARFSWELLWCCERAAQGV